MKKTNKFIALTLGAAMVCSAMSPVFVNAESAPDFILNPGHYIDAISYRILENDTYADTVYIDSADLKNGDYIFQAGIYLEGDYEIFGDVWHFHTKWLGYDEEAVESKYIQTQNVLTYGYQWNDEKTNMLINECTNIPNTVNYMGPELTMEDNIFAESPYKVKYVDVNTGEETILDVDVNERTGTGTVIIDEKLYNKDSRTGKVTIKHYNPDTPKGETFKIEAAYADIHCLSQMKNAWINKVTGDNKMVQFDVVVDENTPNGTYYIGFRDPKTSDSANVMSGNGKQLYPSNCHYIVDPFERVAYNNDQTYWLKIIVGESKQENAEFDVNNDGKSDINDASSILLTYADNAVKSTTDIPILKSTYMNADVNGDGKVDIADATLVLETYANTAAGIN